VGAEGRVLEAAAPTSIVRETTTGGAPFGGGFCGAPILTVADCGSGFFPAGGPDAPESPGGFEKTLIDGSFNNTTLQADSG
jgi:hypothetical protein